MNVAAWIVTGILAGWLANRILNDGASDGRLGYLAFGVVGAFLGVQLLAPATDPAVVDRNAFDLSLLFYSAAGAGVVLFVGNAIRQRFFP